MANNLITPKKEREKRLFREGDYTFEDFLALVQDGQKADLLDGVIYMASPENTQAGKLLTWLTFILTGFVEKKDLGEVWISRIAYRIGPKRGPEPDLSFVPKELAGQRRFGYIAGPPMLAIEIVSPDSVARDYILKREIYEQAGVREYWIIDPGAQRVTVLVLRRGKYVEMAPVDHVIRSEVVPGLDLDVRWLLRERRPAAYKVLENLLKSRKQKR